MILLNGHYALSILTSYIQFHKKTILDDSYENAYLNFAADGSKFAEEAVLYASLHKEKYYDFPSDAPNHGCSGDSDDDEDDDDDDLCEEDRILRDHPCTNNVEGLEGFPDERKQLLRSQQNQHFEEELDAFLQSGGGFSTENQSETACLPDHLVKSAAIRLQSTEQAHLPQLNNIPEFVDMESFLASLKDPVIVSAEDNTGTADFRNLVQQRPFLIQVIWRTNSVCCMCRPARSVYSKTLCVYL